MIYLNGNGHRRRKATCKEQCRDARQAASFTYQSGWTHRRGSGKSEAPVPAASSSSATASKDFRRSLCRRAALFLFLPWRGPRCRAEHTGVHALTVTMHFLWVLTVSNMLPSPLSCFSTNQARPCLVSGINRDRAGSG